MLRGRILFADNDPDFLKARAEFLQQHYHVLKARTIEEAEELFRNARIHVAILDIRMVDDNDERDISGLLLAKHESYRSIPKILLTGFPSYKDVREALRPALDGLPPAVEFLAKNEGSQRLLDAVEQAFEKHVRINQDLIINWDDLHSFQHLVKLIEPEVANAQLLDYSDELEDLFRKLFYDQKQINIGRLLVRDIGQIVVEAFAYTAAGGEAQLAVSCGRRRQIRDEAERYERFAPRGTVSAEERKPVETAHFAAATYAPFGGAPAEMTTFRDYYLNKPPALVDAALDQLFTTTLDSWHRHGRFYAPGATAQSYYLEWLGLSADPAALGDLAQRIAALCREALAAGMASLDYSANVLTLRIPSGDSATYHSPLKLLADRGDAIEALCGITHGRVDVDTVLVNSKGQTWLIDFAHAGRRPLLCDFALMELTIKLDLLETTDLYARHALELLLHTDAPDDESRRTTYHPEIQRALHVVAHVRRLAAQADHNPRAYLIALYFCAIKRIASYDPTLHYIPRRLASYVHGLLLAAMLCDKLLDSAAASARIPDQALKSLWIDEVNREVWVEGRQIDLTPQEFAILAYLYNLRDQLRSRQDIMQGALGHSYDLSEESRFNSALSRLRQKIEPVPESPKYLITKRGHGYRLVY